MNIDWFRDLVICISGLVVTGVLIFVAILSYLLYRRTKAILDSMKTASKKIEGISSYIREEVAKPLIQVMALVQGIRQGINVINSLFKKDRKGGRDV